MAAISAVTHAFVAAEAQAWIESFLLPAFSLICSSVIFRGDFA